MAELFPSELLLGDDVRSFKAIYSELRDFLNKNGATISHHSGHRIVRQLARGLYDEPEEREVADRLALDIIRGRYSAPQKAVVQDVDDRPRTELSEKVAHSISMRLKGDDRKFSGDKTEFWDE